MINLSYRQRGRDYRYDIHGFMLYFVIVEEYTCLIPHRDNSCFFSSCRHVQEEVLPLYRTRATASLTWFQRIHASSFMFLLNTPAPPLTHRDMSIIYCKSSLTWKRCLSNTSCSICQGPSLIKLNQLTVIVMMLMIVIGCIHSAHV